MLPPQYIGWGLTEPFCANDAELNASGYARDEYVGHHIAEFHVDRPVIDDILRRLAKGETLRDYGARMRAKDGTIKYLSINSNVKWENGKFVHACCFSRDITNLGSGFADARSLRAPGCRSHRTDPL